MEIEYVTHASLLLRTERLSMLLDPFFYPELDPTMAPCIRHYPHREFNLAELGRLDFVFSSHEHNDHCHPETLIKLRDQTETAVIPAKRPELESRYRDAGFQRILFLENQTPTVLADGLEVTSYWDDPVDSCLLIKMAGRWILHLNDCWLKRGSLFKIVKQCTIDYAFCGHTSAQDLYPLILPKPPAQLEELAKGREDAFFAAQVSVLDVLKPRFVIPYVYTLTYVQPEQIHLNGYGRLTPPLFAERLRAARPEVECLVLQPGDVIETETHSVRRYRKENLWGDDLAEFLENIGADPQSLEGRLPRFDFDEPECCEVQLKNHLEGFLAARTPLPNLFYCLNDSVAIHLLGNSRKRSFLVDTRRRSVSELPTQDPSARTPLLEISVPASVMEILLSGVYDALIILSTYRISFQLHESLQVYGFSAAQEHALCVGTFLAIFSGLGHSYLKSFEEMDFYLAMRLERDLQPE